jgi:hypothetical protein
VVTENAEGEELLYGVTITRAGKITATREGEIDSWLPFVRYFAAISPLLPNRVASM